MRFAISSVLSVFSAALLAGNLDYGIPSGTNTHLIVEESRGYSVGYDCFKRQPRWVCYRLEGWMVDKRSVSERVTRKNNFRADYRLGMMSSTPEDYAKSGYDRGHLCPAADMAYSNGSMDDSFLMSNMSPQKPDFNRGIWKDLENWVRTAARKEQSLFVFAGPIFTDTCTNTIANGRIRVPTAFYKIVVDETPPVKTIAFILPNERIDSPFADYECSIDDIEKFTGLSFLEAIPNVMRFHLKKSRNFQFWGLSKSN